MTRDMCSSGLPSHAVLLLLVAFGLRPPACAHGEALASKPKHTGEDCWGACGEHSGYCDWCGSGNACCKKDSAGDPEECRRASGFQTAFHECVVLDVAHPGEDCWGHCSEGSSGFCEWCGRGNACCKPNFAEDPPECARAMGFTQSFHHCVKLSPEGVDAPTTTPLEIVVSDGHSPGHEAQQRPAKPHPQMIIKLQPGRDVAVDPLSMIMGGLRGMPLGPGQHGGTITIPGGRGGRIIGGPQVIMGGPGGGEHPLALLMKALGDASGQLGEASHFSVDDTEAGIRISASLPGHRLGADGPHPLQVRVVGSAVVVKGAHVNPPMVTEFQRTFHMPLRVALSKITVDYSTSTGKLIITVPARIITEGEEEQEEEEARSHTDMGPAGIFRDVEDKLPAFFKERDKILSEKSGFLPSKRNKEKEMADLLSSFEKQFSPGHVVKEDNTTYLGCFAESDLPQERIKVPEAGAFAEMKARARGGPTPNDEVEMVVFNLAPEPMELWMEVHGGARKLMAELAAMTGRPSVHKISVQGEQKLMWVRPRSTEILQQTYSFPGRLLLIYNGTSEAATRFHDEPLQQKREEFFAIARSLGEHVVPKQEWTVSGRGQGFVFSGVPAMPPTFGTDECGMLCIDGQHWCGCDPNADKEVFACPGSQRRYAVYALPLPNGSRAVPPRSRALWHLHEDQDGSPILEVHAPPGRRLKHEDGRVVVVAQSPTSPDGESDDSSASGLAKAWKEVDNQQSEVGVPVELTEDICEATPDMSSIRCQVPKQHVKEVPVRYTNDEL